MKLQSYSICARPASPPPPSLCYLSDQSRPAASNSRRRASEPRSGSTVRRTHKVRISFGNRRRSELPRRCCSSGQIGASAPGPRSMQPVEKKLPSRLVLAHPNQSGRLRLHRTVPQAEERHPGRLLYASEGSPFSATADYLLAPERQGWGGAGPAGGGGWRAFLTYALRQHEAT